MKKKYPSNISRAQFEQIRPVLESARKKTKPRRVDLYEVFCAVLYVLKSGCQWRIVTDRQDALEAVDRNRTSLSQVKALLADGGYTGQPFADAIAEKLHATVQIAKRNALNTFAVIPQRWVVERSFAWLERCRRLWKNCERLLNTSLQFVHLAFLALLLRRS